MPCISPRAVPFFDYTQIYRRDETALQDLMRDVCRRGAFITQQELSAFERNLADFVGADFAIGVGNATDALEIILRAAGIGSGDEVVFSTHTFVATASAIHAVGATPVPADIGADGLIDPAAVVERITSATRAILPTQLNGRTCDMDAIQAIADKYGLLVLEDAAQGLGSRYKGRHAGTFGLGGCLSFYPAKVLGCFGDGGAVITNDQSMAEKVRLARDHGRDKSGEVVCWGRNSRLDNLQAAILNRGLASYGAVMARRREIAGMYQEMLGGITKLTLPRPPVEDGVHFDIFQNYELEAENRDELRSYLREIGVGTMVQWGGKAVHQYQSLGLNASLPKAERFFQRCLMLPMNFSLSDEDVRAVAHAVRGFYRR